MNDLQTDSLHISPGYVTIHGLPDGTTEISRSQWRANVNPVHPGGLEQLERVRSRTFQERRGEYNVDYRINLPGRGARWIEARSFVSYDSCGRAQRVVGVNIDVTERKLAEQTLAERNAQLSLAGKVGLVGTFAYDVSTEIFQISEGYAALYGFPDGTTEVARNECLAGIHPEDVWRSNHFRNEAFCRGAPEYSVEYRIVRPGGEVRWAETRCFISYDHEGRPQRVVGVSIDVTDRKRSEDQKSLLIAELDHRVKNVLTCVGVVAQHSRDTTRSMDEFLEVLDGRLNSLANTHSLLSLSRWKGVAIAELVRSELAPCMKDGNTHIEGPEIVLAAEATQPVSMVLHELATNATKYGALSNSHGRVWVRWRRPSDGSFSGKLVLEWKETGGPPITGCNAAGYGTSVIRDLIPYELGGIVEYELAAQGARCRLEIPIKWLVAHDLLPDVG